MHIISNFQWRTFLDWGQLTEAEQLELDWADSDESNFFRYRGRVYCLGEFMRVTNGMLNGNGKNWHGYASDSFFSGVLIELSNCGDQYKIATYIS